MKTWPDAIGPPANDHVRWTAIDMEYLLDAGRVGLYEIVEHLNVRLPDATATERIHAASQVLDVLLDADAGVLRRSTWLGGAYGAELSRTDVDNSWFDPPGEEGEGEYYVLEPPRQERTVVADPE